MSESQGLRRDPRTIPAACALIALLVGGLAVGMFLAAPGSNLTSLLRMAPNDPIAIVAQELEPELRFVPQGHYDGVYYYAIAIDPVATGEAHELIDLPAHRYGHPGYGWMAWVASAGNPQWVPQALLLLSLAGVALAAYLTSLIAVHLGATPWAGLIAALNPGLVFAVTTDTSEAVTAALLGAALYLWIKDRRTAAASLLVPLCFFKFQMILVPVGLALWEIAVYLRGRRDRETVKTIALLAVGPMLFLAWMLYVQARLDELPISGGPEFLSFPFVGWLDTMSDLSRIAQMTFTDVQIASAQLPILVCLVALFTIGVVRSMRLAHPLDGVFLLQGSFVLLLNWWNLFYPKDMLRALALPIPLLIAVLYIGRRASTDHDGVEGVVP
jgi:hypothetical protein